MAGHMHYNAAQHKEQRHRDEGHHAKHMRGDGSVPITGKHGARIHGKHTGEGHPMHDGHLPHTGRMKGAKMAHAESESMKTPVQDRPPRPKPGMPGRHQEEA